MKELTCFLTVIFPENVIFFKDFVDSINEQTSKNFQLLIFNDGVEDVKTLIGSILIDYEVISLPKELAIAQNRTFILEYLKQSIFKYAIFGDSDDYFPRNRVEVNLRYLSEYDIVINDTHLVDINKISLMSEYFMLKNRDTIAFNNIKNKNCCGLGNTAIKISALPNNISFNSNIAAVDWMLFSRMIYEGNSAVYTNETFIYYRQHNLNSIGLKSITKERLLKGISIKLNHYSNLVDEYNICHKELSEYRALAQYCLNEGNLKRYLESILSLNLQNPMWWEEIKTLQDLKIQE